jgi:putative ABC transport system permease protein
VLRAIRLAWLSVIRQPARSLLGVLGVAAIGALLFDMLLLSRGLVLSFGDLLSRTGFDVRVLASDAPPLAGPRLRGAAVLAHDIAALPEVADVFQVRLRSAEVVADRNSPKRGESATAGGGKDENGSEQLAQRVEFIGADPRVRPMWTIVEGQDLPDARAVASAIVVNRQLGQRLDLRPGSRLSLRGRCGDGSDALPSIAFTVIGVAEFPFDSVRSATVAGTLADADRLCAQENGDQADMLMVRSTPQAGALAAGAAIRARHPELYAVTNEELVERFSRVEFSYFRQISTVLATVTLFFGFLLIAVLLTVSVNQRLAEIAALRAVGLSRSRVTAGVLWESIMLVGAGGLLALPLGAALSMWLDAILRSMPGLPAQLHFFVFEPRALVLYTALLVIASIAAALYPMRIVSVLPIAATLRREVVS